MKVKPEHAKTLIEAVKFVDTPERREAYRQGKIPRAEAVRDLDKRYRWDLLWLATPSVREVVMRVYDYADDTHIDTVLRHAVPPLRP